ncbi:hypothetical protein DPMN_185300 [Dreissena polymorpha]|uniref:Uncharacterized protein n=1 Tax=Dreissena polymorpha TaxID=45954 RepID=A0A9D4DNC4_DREPO|nr:hypothetical protein DPMN_185300 [Dreissena polymorpha]
MPIPQIPVDRKLDGVKIPVDRKLSTASSLDDILSSSPGTRAPSSEDVLAPKVHMQDCTQLYLIEKCLADMIVLRRILDYPTTIEGVLCHDDL